MRLVYRWNASINSMVKDMEQIPCCNYVKIKSMLYSQKWNIKQKLN